MRVLAIFLGITIAAVLVTAFTAAGADPTPPAEALAPEPQMSTPEPPPAGMHMAAAAAGLAALIVLAPVAGRF